MQSITKLQDYIQALAQAQWSGEADNTSATCLQYATDNSVYQVLPSLVLFPKSTSDLQIIFKSAQQDLFQDLHFSLRGGGTGTNGQSLTDGIVIDCSRYMNHILEVNFNEGWVSVEPGVVLDQLNNFLKPHGYFFPIVISTSSRCTLGGMANTNACGKGSCFYGRTEDYVLSVTSVLANGELLVSKAMSLQDFKASNSPLLKTIASSAKVKLDEKFKELARPLTGYGLSSVFKDNQFNPNAVLVGSEGTLSAFSEIKLKIIKLPKVKRLVILHYADFQCALVDGVNIKVIKPEAIETIDGTLLSLAQKDVLYSQVKDKLGPADQVNALSLVECVGDTEEAVLSQVQQLEVVLQDNPLGERLSYQIVERESEIQQLWQLRGKSVGLLGLVEGERKPVSGMEDTLVPPEQLPDFIREYRELLDSEQLDYGMFGHIDAGCLHVRPALDLSQEADKKLYYKLSLKVAELTKKYNGIMWGEHGKGFRSQFVPEVFGDAGFAALCEIKHAFDPRNILNKNKIAVPDGDQKVLTALDQPAVRGDFNQQIRQTLKEEFTLSMQCNGNGACFDYHRQHVMCPSYKVTGDRVQSPKGRATLIREWVRRASLDEGSSEFDQSVYDAMHGCLGCKGCVTQCPVHVNIPLEKSKFLSHYYQSHRRSLRDILFAYSEKLARIQSAFPRLANKILQAKLTRWWLKKFLRLVDPPRLSMPSFLQMMNEHQIKQVAVDDAIKSASEDTVVLCQDWITRSYDASLQFDYYQLLSKIGLKVLLIDCIEDGESFAQLGYLDKAKAIAERSSAQLAKLQQAGVPVVGIEPSLALSHETESSVKLIQEFLMSYTGSLPRISQPKVPLILLMHCTEQSASPQLAKHWIDLFKRFGLTLEVRELGCCGMAGLYGHELEHIENSKKLFEMSWQSVCREDAIILATGFSCRSQAARFSGVKLIHPVTYLNLSI